MKEEKEEGRSGPVGHVLTWYGSRAVGFLLGGVVAHISILQLSFLSVSRSLLLKQEEEEEEEEEEEDGKESGGRRKRAKKTFFPAGFLSAWLLSVQCAHLLLLLLHRTSARVLSHYGRPGLSSVRRHIRPARSLTPDAPVASDPVYFTSYIEKKVS